MRMFKPVLVTESQTRTDLAIVKRDYSEELTNIVHQKGQLEIVYGKRVNLKYYECCSVVLLDTEAEVIKGDYDCEFDGDHWLSPEFVSDEMEDLVVKYCRKRGCNFKAIATSNKYTNLPQLSDLSIRVLIDYYNESGGKMPDWVELNVNSQGEIDIRTHEK